MDSADFSPCAVLLETGRSEQDLRSPASRLHEIWDVTLLRLAKRTWSLQVLHMFPNTAVHSAQAQMLSPLLIALAGVTSKLTGQQVVACALLGSLENELSRLFSLMSSLAVGATCQFCSAIASVQDRIRALPGINLPTTAVNIYLLRMLTAVTLIDTAGWHLFGSLLAIKLS